MVVNLDTSAPLKLYIEEEGRMLVREAVGAASTVATSTVAYAEARAGLTRRFREGGFTDEEHRGAVADLNGDWPVYDRLNVSNPVAFRAGELAERHALRGYDPVHMASAVRLSERFEDLCPLAIDDRLNDAARGADLTLFVNGIPVATAELKNALTGQGVEDAKEQYRAARDPKNVTSAGGRSSTSRWTRADRHDDAARRRLDALSAVQPRAWGRQGHPAEPERAPHRLLWERVWEKDAWLDLLGRFVHVERPAKGSKSAGVGMLHDYNLCQKAEVIVEHFRWHVAKRIGAGQRRWSSPPRAGTPCG